MSIISDPFVRAKLDEVKVEEDKVSKVITVRLNADEQLWVKEVQEFLNVAEPSTALKMAAFVGKNVLQGLFWQGNLKYLFKKDRVFLEDRV